ncbi:hypothetical protein [Nitrosomonas supralitoralis]|uniref:hypothetical protein n=1 Tax=Nitrosomonas supralitoralis TaxID=2116706 RepID=UPI0015591553|nr:hypothetical protein [Nitrosomonas supralitoralis]
MSLTKPSRFITQKRGEPSEPFQLMAGLLILKQLENLSNEAVILRQKRIFITRFLFA